MAQTLQVVMDTARTYLNDDQATRFTDTVLLPKAQQAHRELQQILRANSCPVMRKISPLILVASGSTSITLPTDLVEPIMIWEKATTDGVDKYVRMTESDPLPNALPTTTLIYWCWSDEAIALIGASVDRDVIIKYWRSLTLPTVNTSNLGFINGEMFMSPRTAALASFASDAPDKYTTLTQEALSALDAVIKANRGSGVPIIPNTLRP